MTNEKNNSPESCVSCSAEYEINLLELWQVIWKRKMIIISLTIIFVTVTIIVSFAMKNVYRAEATITAVKMISSNDSIFDQLNHKPSLPFPDPVTTQDLRNVINSNAIRMKVFYSHNLMPVLFGTKRNDSHKDAEGLKMLAHGLKIKNNKKDATITVSFDWNDSKIAVQIVEYILQELSNELTHTAKELSNERRNALEKQYAQTDDPHLRNQIRYLINEQDLISRMAEVKENFAFKIIDPPRSLPEKVKPKRVQMIALSFVVSLLMGIFLSFFLEYIERARTNRESLLSPRLKETPSSLNRKY